jgi:hypothetical protein
MMMIATENRIEDEHTLVPSMFVAVWFCRKAPFSSEFEHILFLNVVYFQCSFALARPAFAVTKFGILARPGEVARRE